MPTIEQDISSQSQKVYNKLKKEHGEEHVFEYLLAEFKEFEKVESEKEELTSKLEQSKEKIAKLKDQLEESKTQEKEAPAMSNIDIVPMLNETISSLKSLNESYARENERLLKISNFSEYDDKINSLKADITSHSKTILDLQELLKTSKESCVNFEMKALKLEEEKQAITLELESKKTEVSGLVNKVAKYDSEKAQLESTVTSYVEELRRYKDMIEEMKAATQIQAEQSEPEAPTYS